MSESSGELANQQNRMLSTKTFYRALLAILVIMLGACATALQPDNYAERITATRLGASQFLVGYAAGPTGDDPQAIDLTLLRSAEIALQHGFHYFVVVEPEPVSAAVDSQQGGTTETIEYQNGQFRYTEPASRNTIICFNARPPGRHFVALFVKASLRSKYDLDSAL